MSLVNARKTWRPGSSRRSCRSRQGLTLIELVISTSMMLMLAGVLGGLAAAVQSSADYSRGHGVATQQARVALERITRAVRKSTATAEHPGFVVVASQVNGWRYPDTLLVWRPAGQPANPLGPPLVRELVIYAPHPTNPGQLLEITAPTDNRPLPFDAPLDQSPWIDLIDSIKSDPGSRRVVLCRTLRVAAASATAGTTSASVLRGAVRFERELRPSAVQWSTYKAGNLAWSNLSWAQGIHGSTTGLRQAWLRVELQLVPDLSSLENADKQAIPFIGSAARFYDLPRAMQ